MPNVANAPALRPLAAVIGLNCRRLRGDVTRNELAKYARGVGLRWDTSKVRDFESGRSAPTFATVLAASLALSYATGGDVTVADLVATPLGEVAVVLNDRLAPLGEKVAAAVRGEPLRLGEDDHFSSLLIEVQTQLSTRQASPQPIDEVKSRSGLDEERLTKRLGIDADALAAASLQLWRRSFSDERDRRAGPGANPQKRGRISRELQAELKKVLGDGND